MPADDALIPLTLPIFISGHPANLRLLSFNLGFTALISQVLFLRELITVFAGNETSYSLILGAWLFWMAAGSLLAGRSLRLLKSPVALLAVLHGLVGIILVTLVVLIRASRILLGIRVGEIIGVVPMFLISFGILALLTLILGAIFTLLCQLAAQAEGGRDPLPIGQVYVWESVGAVCGGVLFSFLLVRLIPALDTAFLLALINAAMMLVLLKRRGAQTAVAVVLFIMAGLYPFGLIGRLDQFSRRAQWPGFKIVSIEDSIYGNIALLRLYDEYSLFESGLFSYSTRDRLTSEEEVHFALLEHPNPAAVLLIGNGVGGHLNEILKYPGVQVDYVELDPKVIDVAKKNLPPAFVKDLTDPRVRVIFSDARLFIKQGRKNYDVILVNLPDPSSALINRYYSVEFFQEAGRRLNRRGILSLSVSSSENYLSAEAARFLRSINTSLGAVFPDVISIPGDNNIFIACKQRGVLTDEVGTLLTRLKARNVRTQFVREYFLPFKLSPDRMAYIEDVLSQNGKINTDMRPIAYFYDIVLWSSHFDLFSKGFPAIARWVNWPALLVVIASVFAAGFLLRRHAASSPIVLSIAATGLSEMIFQVVIIMAFQTLYGYVYDRIGLLIAAFMGGLVVGSLWARRLIVAGREPGRIYSFYQRTQASIVLYPLLLPLIFQGLGGMSGAYPGWMFSAVFACLPVIAGIVGGLQYPLAAYLLSSQAQERKDAYYAGGLYAADTWGASLGALLAGAILIPILGIAALAYFCAALNAAVWLLLRLSAYPGKVSSLR